MKYFRQLILILGLFSWISLPVIALGQCGGGSFMVLHYTETSGFNHNTRNQSLSMFQAIGTGNNFTVVNDTDGSEFNSLANLQQYAVVIFSNTSGNNILNATQRTNFEAYIQQGGSYVGIHAASDTYRHSSANGNSRGTWDWYAENVAGASVQQGPNHTSQNHNNDMDQQVPGHPTLAGLPNPWNKTEEYYYWQNGYLNNSFTEVLRVRQTGGASYDAARMTTHIKELQWGGRSFYTSLGHAQSNFTGDQNFRTLLTNAVNWAAAPNTGGGTGNLSLSVNITDATCEQSNGSIDLSVSGGSGTYTYSWSNGATSQDISGLSGGFYTVQVDDGNGCTDNQTYSVGNMGLKPSLALFIDQEISCFGADDGEISSNVLGNSGPYSYSWNTGQSSPNLTAQGPGFYELIVTNVASCSDTASASLSEPDALQLNIQIQDSPSCTDPLGGNLLGQGSGGTGTIDYLWNTGATTPNISGLDTGLYVLVIQDDNNCTLADSVSLSLNSFSISLSQTQEITCFGDNDGAISATVNGGTAPLTYLWSNGQTTASANSLSAGWQVLTVTDGQGCVRQDSLFLTQPDSLQTQITVVNPVSCFGENDAVLQGNPTGGTSPYTYIWNGTNGVSQLSNLGVGTYVFEVRDARACRTEASLTLSGPDSLVIQLTIDQNISCNGASDGVISAAVLGGTPAYTYAWSNGASTATISGLNAGGYSLTITDANGCQKQASISLAEPTAIDISLSLQQEVSCFGGMDGIISAAVSGGSPAYSYLWSSGDTDGLAENLAAGM
ncbi:MAG: ThuA domain-containing protein, partial [Bacteroidota bacterium]